MKRFWLFYIGILIFLPVFSQQEIARLELGNRDPKPEFYEYCPTDKGLVTLGPMTTVSTREYGLIKYDQNLKKQWMKPVFEQNGRKHLDLLTVIGENIMVFVSEYFPKEKVVKTFYSAYDLKGKAIIEDQVLTVYPNQTEQKVDLSYILSPDKRKLLCFKDLSLRREADQVKYYLFDDQGEREQDGEIIFKYSDDKFSLVDLRVSNEGNIFALGKHFPAGKNTMSDNYRYLLFRYDRSNSNLQEIKIEFDTKIITDLAFRLDKDENVYLAGFYSNMSSSRIIGTIFRKISGTGQTLTEAVEEFSDEFKAKFLSQGQIERGKELANFSMHHDQNDNGIILRSDGGVLLMAERYYQTYQTFRDVYGYWTQQTMHHYEEVILTSIDPSGKIEWHAIVDKNQVDLNPSRCSYFYAIGEKGAYIFYDYSPRKQGPNVYYNLVEMDGQTSVRIPLFKDYRFGNEYYPQFSYQVSNNEALIVYYTRNGRGLSMVRMKIN